MISSCIIGISFYLYFFVVNLFNISKGFCLIINYYKFFLFFVFIQLSLSLFFQIELVSQPFFYFLIGISQLFVNNFDLNENH